ncbi:MAG: hypothetical protein M3N37_03600 [Actinomycetota bacterium]|nr:hypothetical protein [Actinomycetota bacterium]
MAHQEATGGEGEAGPAVGVVDLLGEGFHGVEGGNVQGQAGHHHQRRGPGPGAHQRGAGHGAEDHHAHDPHGREAGDAGPAAPPGGQSAPARRREADPRPGPGSLLGQTATEQHHGTQVLEGDGEAQLRHQARPPPGRFQGGPAHAGQTEPGHDQGGGRPAEGDWSKPEAAQGQATQQGRGRQGGARHQVRPGRGHHAHGEQVHRRRRGPSPRRHQGGAHHRYRHQGPGQRGVEHGHERLDGQPTSGQEAGHGSGHGAHKGPEAELAHGRPTQRRAPVDGGQQHVLDGGRLQGQGTAPSPRPQAQGDEDGDAGAQQGWALGCHPGGGAGAHDLVGDEGGAHDGGHPHGQRRQVGVVERVEPVDVVEPPSPAGPAELGQHRRPVDVHPPTIGPAPSGRRALVSRRCGV